ncbi:MAG: hypothetical protein MUE94_08030 [Verrucomicrobia bacterium]|jgi:hypothetical protein|nr:hypothetical protein [Verrucomicrobiota bacterium]
MKTKLEIKHGQPSWRVANSEVEAFVTETGGHIGPVTFKLGEKKIQPFSIAPWAQEQVDPSLPPILKVLRGDFFCLPFGGNATQFKDEQHPVHGETANAKWKLESAVSDGFHLSLNTKIRAGRVDKYIHLRPGQTAVYQRHVISGMTGPMNFGHHAMLRFPDSGGRVSTSRFVQGKVVPVPLENPANGGYSCLQPGGNFLSLAKVPLANGGFTDLSVYPARRGFEDIVMLQGDDRQPFAWTAVVFSKEGYVWFALKDPRVLRQTIFWLSNGGRHYPPWNGRHVNVLGVEEATSYFHYGLAESAKTNSLSAQGHATCHPLNPNAPLRVNYLMAVAAIPKGFDRVKSIRPAENGQSVKLTSHSGRTVAAPVDLSVLELGKPNPEPLF